MDRKFVRTQAATVNSMKSPFWRPKLPGKYKFRLLDGDPTFFVDVATHFNLGPKKARSVCPKQTSSLAKKSRECPVCDYIAELSKGTAADRALADSMKANTRFLMNIYLRPSSTDASGGLKIAGFGKSVFDQIYELVMDTEDYGDIVDVNEGRDIILHRTGTGLETKYTIAAPGPNSPLLADPKGVEAVLSKRADLNKFAQAETVAAIIAKLEGNTEEAEAAEAEEVEQKVSGEVEDEPAEPESEAVEEEEAPAPPPAKPRAAPAATRPTATSFADLQARLKKSRQAS